MVRLAVSFLCLFYSPFVPLDNIYEAFTCWCIRLVKKADMRASDRLSAHLDILKKQFSRPTVAGGDGIDLTSDGYSDFFVFSTGRRTISSLHTIFTLRPRHDLFQLAFQSAWGLIDLLYTPKDDMTLDFTLHTTVAVPEFVWALVAKGEASSIKKERWDLVSQSSSFPSLRRRFLPVFLKAAKTIIQTFTKTTENPQLPPNVVIMSGK